MAICVDTLGVKDSSDAFASITTFSCADINDASADDGEDVRKDEARSDGVVGIMGSVAGTVGVTMLALTGVGADG